MTRKKQYYTITELWTKTQEKEKKRRRKEKKNSQQLFIQGVFTKKRKEKAKPFAFGKKDTSFRVYLHKSFVKYSFFFIYVQHVTTSERIVTRPKKEKRHQRPI